MSEETEGNGAEETELPNKQGVRLNSQSTSQEPELDFSTYIISLGHTVQIALGHLPSPDTNHFDVDLDVARNFIGVLEILKEKTKGNLSSDEERLMTSMLYELKLQFVAATKNKSEQ